LRLLLDEQYSHQIAQHLRAQGFDVVAVVERAELVGVSDNDLLDVAASEGRALLTNNVRDFVPIVQEWAASGRSHSGVLLTSDATMPRSRKTIGAYVKRLTAVLESVPAEDGLREQVRWLS
jgi:hypothetical protein